MPIDLRVLPQFLGTFLLLFVIVPIFGNGVLPSKACRCPSV